MAQVDEGIVATGVQRRFRTVEALRGMDLRADPGEVTALAGPNGAGKTTLLLVLATLLKPDAGTVRIAGLDPSTDHDAVQARIGWSPDAFGLYEGVTAREYLASWSSLSPPRRWWCGASPKAVSADCPCWSSRS